MTLSADELALTNRHLLDLQSNAMQDELLLRYYRGRQRVEQLGMAIPPEMRRFLVVANWCRVVVDTTCSRQQVRSMIVPGGETADPRLRAIADASNFSAHVHMFNVDRQVYGRAFMSVGTNEQDARLPLIRVESPREMSAFVDPRHEVITSAARFYGYEGAEVSPRNVTLYLPDGTVHAVRDGATWVEESRDPHRLGAVPVVMHLNRRLSGAWVGESQMTDIIPFVDSAARSLTNMQFAQEAHGIPRMYMTGVAKGDFVGQDGKPIPQFEAYFNAIHTIGNAQGKVGQLDAADLKNFDTAVELYGKQASIVTGFPARYFGLTSANPPAEGAIHADEGQLVRSVETQNEQVGVTLGWVGALALRMSTGSWETGNRVRVEWFDPATPTVAQREDALAKRRAVGVLSREGYWDELGWSDARKDKERQYLRREREEDADPYLTLMRAKESAGAADADAEPAEVR